MNEAGDICAQHAERWIRWASEDLVLACGAHAQVDAVPRGACAWAHQCAEKALKAIIVAHDIDPPKTHNLLQLEQLVATQLAGALADIDLEALTRWSIEGRYPEDLEEATEEDAAHAIESASAVLTIVQETLAKAPGATPEEG
jgi:HEPN domain-containing protein